MRRAHILNAPHGPGRGMGLGRSMMPVKILIEANANGAVSRRAARYVLRALMESAGLACHFVSPGTTEAVDICYGTRPDAKCRLFIRMGDALKSGREHAERVVREEDQVFVVFDGDKTGSPIVSTEGKTTRIENDLIAGTYHLLSGGHEGGLSLDGKGCLRVESSFLYQQKVLHVPLIDGYAELLRRAFSESHAPLGRWPAGKRYAIALTHDVDYPVMVKWIEVLRYLTRRRLRARASVLGDILSGKNSFWCFGQWMDWEKKHGVRSAFYFCGLRGSLARYVLRHPDPFYDVRTKPFREEMRRMHAEGFEVGMHASCTACLSAEQFGSEKAAVEEASGKVVQGNRHHYWRMKPGNPAETARLHEEIGLRYDTSICYNGRAGFRCGVCSPFSFFDEPANRELDVLELPTTVMDDHFMRSARLGYLGTWEEELRTLLAQTRRVGGLFLADYHVRGFNETFYPGWRTPYEGILRTIDEDSEVYCDTPANIAGFRRERRERIRRQERDDDRCVDQ